MHTYIRTSLLILAVAGVAFSASANQLSAESYNFRVYLDDKPIGYHQFKLNHTGAGKQVTSEAKFDVKVLFVNAFKYRHSSSESWSDNCLMAIDSQTVSNGKQQKVKGARVDEVLQIDSTAGETSMNGCVQTFAYWNPSILEANTLLNSQTGDYVDIDVKEVGRDTVAVAGKPVEAIKYNLTSAPDYAGKPVDITLWYDTARTEWLALESLAKGKRKIRYERTDTLALQSASSAGAAGN